MSDEYENLDDDGNFLEEEEPQNGETILCNIYQTNRKILPDSMSQNSIYCYEDYIYLLILYCLRFSLRESF